MSKFGKIIFWLTVAALGILLIAWAFSLDIILGLLFICLGVAAFIDYLRENKEDEKKDTF